MSDRFKDLRFVVTALPSNGARPNEKWGEIISCFIRTEADQELDVQALRRHCREHLSPQKTPVVWCRVDALPLTGPGKIQKFALRDGYLAGDYDGGKHDR